jgi:hypothetical protein
MVSAHITLTARERTSSREPNHDLQTRVLLCFAGKLLGGLLINRNWLLDENVLQRMSAIRRPGTLLQALTHLSRLECLESKGGVGARFGGNEDSVETLVLEERIFVVVNPGASSTEAGSVSITPLTMCARASSF